MIDLTAILANLSRSLTNVQHLLGGLSYLIGIAFFLMALIKFREITNQSAQGGGEHKKMMVPIAYLGMGALLLFMPTSFNAFSNTLFGSGASVLQYAGYDPYDIYSSMTILIETVGIVWFIRGCVLLVQSSQPEHGEEGSKGFSGKAFLFIIAGLFAINFHSTVNMMDYVMNNLLTLTGMVIN